MKTIPHACLADYTTFRLGGSCRSLIECATPDELITAVKGLNRTRTPFILIGGGSNLVVSDQGIDTAVIRYLSPNPLITHNNNEISISASTVLDDLALFCVEQGLEGLNFTTGIPGTVGGAVIGNAGAWGKQVGDILSSALILDPNGNSKAVDPGYFAFSYRHSRLKETDEIVATVTFSLKNGDPVKLAQERAAILRTRAEKHPDLNTHPCAGSFFRNIEATSKAEKRQAAGWFLEQAGGKDLRSGGARIFAHHANIIVKADGCSAQDVHDLHVKMKQTVAKQFGLELIREVRFVGSFAGCAESNPNGFW